MSDLYKMAEVMKSLPKGNWYRDDERIMIVAGDYQYQAVASRGCDSEVFVACPNVDSGGAVGDGDTRHLQAIVEVMNFTTQFWQGLDIDDFKLLVGVLEARVRHRKNFTAYDDDQNGAEVIRTQADSYTIDVRATYIEKISLLFSAAHSLARKKRRAAVLAVPLELAQQVAKAACTANNAWEILTRDQKKAATIAAREAIAQLRLMEINVERGTEHEST